MPTAPTESKLLRTARAIRREAAAPAVQEYAPAIRAALIAEWDQVNESNPAGADERIQERAAGLDRAHASLAFDEDSIKAKAKDRAARCRAVGELDKMEAIATRADIAPPAEKKYSPAGRKNRLRCDKWWRRQLRRYYSRAAEGHMREIGLVQKSAGLYCSDATLERRHDQRQRGQELLREIIAVNDSGEAFTLLELAKSSLSNPELRRAELMVRIRGFEECAEAAGHVGEFYTFTTPSRFHAYTNGKANPKYEAGLDPRASQAHLCDAWAAIRAKLARLSIRVYGFRVAEPHHDGTTHWHLLLFMPTHQRDTVREICRAYLLAESPSERGAKEHRFKAVAINPAKGTAAGYVAKYIAKNIDGFEVGADFESAGANASDTARRVDAWASTWGVRQFQQVGGPPVGLWRELRRIRDVIAESDRLSGDVSAASGPGLATVSRNTGDSGVLELARRAADSGDWREFVDVLGGPTQARDALPVALEKELSTAPNEYGDERAAVVVGVRCAALVILTRESIWTFFYAADFGGAWTRVNNCTPDAHRADDEYMQFMTETEPPPQGKPH